MGHLEMTSMGLYWPLWASIGLYWHLESTKSTKPEPYSPVPHLTAPSSSSGAPLQRLDRSSRRT